MAEINKQEVRLVEKRSDGPAGYEVRIAQYDNQIDLGSMDLDTYMTNPVVLWNHDQDRIPIARTKSLRRNDDGSIDAQLEWNTHNAFAREVKKSVDAGYINAASIAFVPGENGTPARMVEWSWVDVPADEFALRKSVEAFMHDIFVEDANQEAPMTNTEIEALVKKTMAEHMDKPTFDKEALGNAIGEAVSSAVDSRIKVALDERDAALQAASTAEEEKQAAEQEIERRSAERAGLLVNTKGMLPEDFSATDKTDREIIVAALGDRVADIETKSDDYLKARLDMEIETRAQGASRVVTKSVQRNEPASERLIMEDNASGNILAMVDARDKIATT